jgi:hypothetical protein
VSAPISFDYAVVRVVPRPDLEEFINAGAIVFSAERKYLEACVQVNEVRLRALWPDIDVDLVRQHLEAIPRIAAGDPSAGPVAGLSQSQRFHWLVAPRSTIIQISPVHSGVCEQPDRVLENLARRLGLH